MLAHAIPTGTTLTMAAISRSVRLAHSVKKKMLFACVHMNGIQYIEFARIKM
jgi:tRNA-intron endonuclease